MFCVYWEQYLTLTHMLMLTFQTGKLDNYDYTIKDVSPSTIYRIYVIALSHHGSSLPSYIFMVKSKSCKCTVISCVVAVATNPKKNYHFYLGNPFLKYTPFLSVSFLTSNKLYIKTFVENILSRLPESFSWDDSIFKTTNENKCCLHHIIGFTI